MRRCWRSCSLVLIAFVLAACPTKTEGGGGDGSFEVQDPLTRRLMDPDATTDERIDRVLAEAKPGNTAALPALLRVMRHRSQAAFLVVSDGKARFGYRTVELRETQKDTRSMERVAAIVALEAINSPVALPDLVLALDDVNEVVQNHAARALVRLGNRAGIPTLIANLDNRILQRETANRLLEEISGKQGFIADAGWAERQKGLAAWQEWWAGIQASDERLPIEGRAYQIGADAEADRRIGFFVDVVGQYQFLFHEQARKALIRIGEPALPFLREGVERARKDDNATTRAGIAQILETIDHPNGRELLRDLLTDASGSVRARAAEAFGNLAGKGAIAALQGVLGDRDPGVPIAALDGLGRIGGADALAVIRRYVPGEDSALQEAHILATFAASRGREQRDRTLAMLLGVSIATRNAAHAVLVRITGDDAGYDSLATESARKEAMERYRGLLGG